MTSIDAALSNVPQSDVTASPDPLSRIYSNIGNAAMELQDWPDSSKFLKSLSRNSKGKPCPPAFYDGHGPIGVFAMLHRNEGARLILKQCSEAFDSFCKTLEQEILKADQWQDMQDLIFRPCESSHHVCVSIFHEHPSLLHSEQDKLNWRPIDTKLRNTLVERLSEYQSSYCHSPTLSLNSILWTPDGAMIAGFVDTSTGATDYNHLRSSSADIAKSVMGGELTTRPKNLIHVTIGRIIGLPDGTSKEQRDGMTNMMRSYNQHILPRLVRLVCNSMPNGCFTLTHVSLVRNKIWLMEDYIEHASWPLRSTRQHAQKEQPSLSQTYSDLRQSAICQQPWPDFSKLRADLVHDTHGRLSPPSFPDGNGPIGVMAMLHRNRDSREILKECSDKFDDFCQIVEQEILKPSQWNDMKDCILTQPPESHHICIYVFQSHPSILHSEQDKQNWRPVDKDICDTLKSRLSDHQTRHCTSPTLLLDSLLWTRDGAMIAGFIDVSNDDSFGRLRQCSADIAKSVLGTLTTRPKNLIHVTIGRILGLPESANKEQQEALSKLMQSFNQEVLPNAVVSIQKSTRTKGCFSLIEVSLIRNTVWLMYDHIELASWRLVARLEQENKN